METRKLKKWLSSWLFPPVSNRWRTIVLLAVPVLFAGSGCATYYQRNHEFQQHFVRGEIEQAQKVLDKSKRAAKGKDKLLFYLQKGVVLQMIGEYEQSNNYLEQAYVFSEDYRKNPALEVASLLTNPSIKPYTGEDHELVLIHYYKAMNFLMLADYEAALVECRRLNNRLNWMNDRYENRKNRYRQDAFAMNLMGMVYEASGDVNNAFIAYRNAYEAYRDDYREHFRTDIPQQLKYDLLRTAYLNGFAAELDFYERTFETTYVHSPKADGELILFWQNGLGPVKDEWSLNFVAVKQQGGIVFTNDEYGMSFPFTFSSSGGEGKLEDLKFVRVAFPRYRERKPLYHKAEVVTGTGTYPLEMAENVNAIAISTLEDRMMRELANSLLRLAVKQVSEQTVRKKNEHLGMLLSAINAVTEKADTRNWQTLPYSISYTRVPLKEGNNQVRLKTYGPYNESNMYTFEFQGVDGKTRFHNYHSLESRPLRLE